MTWFGWWKRQVEPVSPDYLQRLTEIGKVRTAQKDEAYMEHLKECARVTAAQMIKEFPEKAYEAALAGRIWVDLRQEIVGPSIAWKIVREIVTKHFQDQGYGVTSQQSDRNLWISISWKVEDTCPKT